MNKILNILKKTAQFIFLTNIGRILLLFALAPTFLFLSEAVASATLSVVLYYAFMACIGALLVYTVVFIVFAWIINPIREYKSNKKLQEELKNKQTK